MTARLTDALCTQCGLCCDGSLLADVELSGEAEATPMRLLGLRVDDDADEPLMLLPCAGLAGTRCTVYEHRPQCCRSFECHLLVRTRRGVVAVEQARATIRDARGRIAAIRKLLGPGGTRRPSLPLREACAEAAGSEALDAAVADLDALLQREFLGRRAAGD